MPPAKLFLKHPLKVRLSLVKPDLEAAIRRRHDQQRKQHSHGTKMLRTFLPGDTVAVLQFRGQEKWALDEVFQSLGPVSYMVTLCDIKICQVHVDHIVVVPQHAPLQDT